MYLIIIYDMKTRKILLKYIKIYKNTCFNNKYNIKSYKSYKII